MLCGRPDRNKHDLGTWVFSSKYYGFWEWLFHAFRVLSLTVCACMCGGMWGACMSVEVRGQFQISSIAFNLYWDNVFFTELGPPWLVSWPTRPDGTPLSPQCWDYRCPKPSGFSVSAWDQIQLLTPVRQMLFQLNHLLSTSFSLLALYFRHIPKLARHCGVI